MKAIVVGGGISGIAASYYLREAGADVTLIEAGRQLGGRLAFARLGDRPISLGGKNIGSRYTEFRKFCRALGVDDFEYFGINTSRVVNGRLVAFDQRKGWRALYQLLASNAPRDLWRFFRFAQRIRRHPDDGFADSPFFHAVSARHDRPVLRDLFGARFCRDWIRPMVVRMNGAESDEVYLSTFGSNLRVALDSYDQLSSGMERLIEAFATTVSVRLNTRVRALEVEDRRVRGVIVDDAGGHSQRLAADAVCVALPAPFAAELAQPHAAELAARLAQVRYFPVHVIVAHYRRPVFRPEIRAVLFDESHALSNAGAYGANDLATVRYTFSGRAARPLIVQRIDNEALISLAEQTLSPYMPVDRRDRLHVTAHTFDPGLCAFAPDIEALNRALDTQSALAGAVFTGDYRKGASMEACFVAARACTARLAAGAVHAAPQDTIRVPAPAAPSAAVGSGKTNPG
ncbi:FAD-dependent oxidoreductase [Aquabacterium sp. A7-Y]|uniref:protoporphyrinogen/coproporphyrinogen oxidase n=1 Tax=Aquabacterium sp. A7-Y TaxID=1349605 RepID=UPI00223E10DC|nr:FAD-dependent oxidoreductase [Aquabacterium sp. A7-Y]MCW7541685.1 FAD-dependent oxidoreductase [Aquabacterium sp. A7-Y]